MRHAASRGWIFAALAVAVVWSATAADRPERLRTTFQVTGMHCDGCSATIIGTLERIDGVVEATADHEKGVAEAEYLSKKVSAEELKVAIEKLGYEVTSMETEAVED